MTKMDEMRDNVAQRLRLPVDQVFGGQRLSEVLAASPVAINSIDLLDAFAGAIADQGLDDELDLPAFTLNHSASPGLSYSRVSLPVSLNCKVLLTSEDVSCRGTTSAPIKEHLPGEQA